MSRTYRGGRIGGGIACTEILKSLGCLASGEISPRVLSCRCDGLINMPLRGMDLGEEQPERIRKKVGGS